MEWIEQVYEFPEHEQTQTDGRKRKWGYIKEVDKYLKTGLVIISPSWRVEKSMDRTWPFF